MHLVELALLLLAGLGHFICCCAAANRIHALGLDRRLLGLLSMACWSTLLLLPLALFGRNGDNAVALVFAGDLDPLFYLLPCWWIAVHSITTRVVRQITRPDLAPVLLSNHTASFDMSARLGRRPVRGLMTRLASRLPGNQLLRLDVHEKSIRIAQLPPQLEGLRIAHLSDLHMSGQIERGYFRELVDLTNQHQPDLVAITGDLFDRNECLDWIGDSLARLKAPCGVFFILGNHDLRIDAGRARRELVEAGLVDLGGAWHTVDRDGASIVLAGNELPWFAPAANLDEAPADDDSPTLRMLLSHAPDQLAWAKRGRFDLMLAGHTHGGQIRLPGIGPIVAPSKLGTQYASGTFYLPPMVMHVTRGISSITTVRYHCPPELAILTLHGEADA